MGIAISIIGSVLFVCAMIALGSFLYRWRGMGRATDPDTENPEQYRDSEILNFIRDTIKNGVFVFPLALIGAMATGSLWGLLLLIPGWWFITQIGHGTVFFDNRPDHAPLRKRKIDGEKIHVEYGHPKYQPWYIAWFNPFTFPSWHPWDVRFGLFITALWVVIFPAIFLLAFGAWIPAVLVLLSALTKPIAYWFCWNLVPPSNGLHGTVGGEVGYGFGCYLFWAVTIVLLFQGII